MYSYISINIYTSYLYFYITGLRRRVTLDKDKNGALGISIAGGLGSPIGDRPVIIAYAQGQAASKVAVSNSIRHLHTRGSDSQFRTCTFHKLY